MAVTISKVNQDLKTKTLAINASTDAIIAEVKCIFLSSFVPSDSGATATNNIPTGARKPKNWNLDPSINVIHPCSSKALIINNTIENIQEHSYFLYK